MPMTLPTWPLAMVFAAVVYINAMAAASTLTSMVKALTEQPNS